MECKKAGHRIEAIVSIIFPSKGPLYAIEGGGGGGNRNKPPRLSFHSRERNIRPSGVTFSLQTGFSYFQ